MGGKQHVSWKRDGREYSINTAMSTTLARMSFKRQRPDALRLVGSEWFAGNPVKLDSVAPTVARRGTWVLVSPVAVDFERRMPRGRLAYQSQHRIVTCAFPGFASRPARFRERVGGLCPVGGPSDSSER